MKPPTRRGAAWSASVPVVPRHSLVMGVVLSLPLWAVAAVVAVFVTGVLQ